MRDFMFFPLAAVLAGVFVTMALQPWAERVPSGPVSCGECADPEDRTVDGKDLHRFVPGNYNGLKIVTPPEGGPPVLRITRNAEETYENPQSGPNIVIDSDLEYAFENRPIEVIITARSAGDFPAEKFEANYYARAEDNGQSGWKAFDLTPEFKPYSFTFETPRYGGVTGYDMLGIRPVAPDKHRVMEVKSVRIHPVGPKKAS